MFDIITLIIYVMINGIQLSCNNSKDLATHFFFFLLKFVLGEVKFELGTPNQFIISLQL